MAKKKAAKKKPSREVVAFAEALEEWAAQAPDRDQKQRLLRWLLSRCESRGFNARGQSTGNKYIVKRTAITDIDIYQAVMAALEGYNPDLSTSGWIRGGPVWPKAYGDVWPKAYSS